MTMIKTEIAGLKLGFIINKTNNTKDLFSPNHQKYNVVVYNYSNNNKHRTFTYQCPKQQEPLINDVVWCLLLDRDVAERCKTFEDYLSDFRGGDYLESREEHLYHKRTFRQLQLYKERFEDLFTQDQIKVLEEHYKDY